MCVTLAPPDGRGGTLEGPIPDRATQDPGG